MNDILPRHVIHYQWMWIQKCIFSFEIPYDINLGIFFGTVFSLYIFFLCDMHLDRYHRNKVRLN